MVFSKYMQSLPNQQTDTIKQIAILTSSTTTSVYRWIAGKARPPLVKQKLIAEFLGFKLDELFPPEEKGGKT